MAAVEVAAQEVQMTARPPAGWMNPMRNLRKQATGGRPFLVPSICAMVSSTSRLSSQSANCSTGASDPDGDNLAVLSLAPNSGMLEKLGPDRWLFTPARDQARPVTFQYEITDGSAAVSQVAHSDFLPRHGDDITGTALE